MSTSPTPGCITKQTIYVSLLDEGTPCYRPVEAILKQGDIVLNLLCNTFEKARHSREGGNPESRATHWIPAFAGMTDDDVAHRRLSTIFTQSSAIIPTRKMNIGSSYAEMMCVVRYKHFQVVIKVWSLTPNYHNGIEKIL